MKKKRIITQQTFPFEPEESSNRLPSETQEKVLLLCAQMVMEQYRRTKKEVRTDESENHF